MSYVDAYYDKNKDRIFVAERINGERILTEFEADHTFYYSHPSGSHISLYGDTCKKYSTNSSQKFRKELNRINYSSSSKNPVKIFESDINPIFRSLANHYSGVEAPELNIGFFDIEVDFDPEFGFAPPDDPFNKITAISVYLSHLNKMVTLVLCPPTYSPDDGNKICGTFEDTYLYTDEKQLLKDFMEVIQDVDVLSGWNSSTFDIPYIVNRIIKIIGSDATRELCLWNQKPRKRMVKKFKKELESYDLVGRVHLDYLELYQKHNPQQLHSYRLDYVGEIEVKENKIPYEGTLDDLYKKDFPKFIEYNRQDTILLHKIDQKKRFIELANQVAHNNCVLLKTTMGSVALVEQAIINEMHQMNLIAPDRKKQVEEISNLDLADDDDDEVDDGRTPVVGAYVAQPKKGLHSEIGCVDINSLYPSAIRALNISPETIVGQVRLDATMLEIENRIKSGIPKKDAWEGIFRALEVDYIHEKNSIPITVDFEDGTTRVMSGRDLYKFIFDPNNQLCISANGTIFSTRKTGIIPLLLAKWYAERQEMQEKQRSFEKKLKEATSPEEEKEIKYWISFWNQRQQARKILLNSLYGALLNEGLRFYDERMGQSVTLTGRSIVKHMNSKINEIIAEEYDYKGDAIVYSDTDSSYFTADKLIKENGLSREQVIDLYDAIADEVNDSFPQFMHKEFNTSIERGSIIKAGRELVASRGLFIKKKKYAVLMYDKEGERLDIGNKPGKLKPMGLDLKRSDTPKFMQVFLEKILIDLLTGVSREEIFDQIKKFRTEFTSRPAWEKGTPKKVNALSDYAKRKRSSETMSLMDAAKLKKGTKHKVNTVSHIEAAVNWNKLRDINNDRYSMTIGDGAKIIVCKLKKNHMNIERVAYPIDEMHLPEWFKKLPFDHSDMENTIIDMKLKNLLGVLSDWNLSETKEKPGDEFFVFK